MTKCKNCGSSWNNPNEKPGMMIKCPFCGHIIQDNTIRGQLRILLQEDEYRMLTKSTRVSAILADYFPKDKREIATIKNAMDVGVGSRFYAITQNKELNVFDEIANIQSLLIKEAWLAEEASDYICETFFYAIDKYDIWEDWRTNRERTRGQNMPQNTSPEKAQPQSIFGSSNTSFEDFLSGIHNSVVKRTGLTEQERNTYMKYFPKDLEKLAGHGDVVAMYMLGYKYEYGLDGLIPNIKDIKKWYTQAAENGYEDAYYHLYALSGDEAVLKIGLDKNNAKCMFTTGYKAYFRKEVKYGTALMKQAFPFLLSEAQNGDAVSQELVACSYEYGLGTEQNIMQARMWYIKAATQGNLPAIIHITDHYGQLGISFFEVEQLLRNLSKMPSSRIIHLVGEMLDHLNHSYEEVSGFYKKAAKLGCYGRHDTLKGLYNEAVECKNRNTPEALTKAARLYRMVVDGGEMEKEAHCFLAKFHQNEPKKRIVHLHYAAHLGDVESMYELGKAYENGIGTAIDEEKELYWYYNAASSGFVAAQLRMGYLYYSGKNVDQSMPMAFDFFMQAAKAGDVEAMNNVGAMYEAGLGIEKNSSQAVFWYKKACDLGSEQGRKNLDRVTTKW